MSTPAFSGYQPNRFHPMPRKPVPSPCSLIAVLPLMPTPGAVATLLQPTLGSAQESHPCAPAPAPSPSQTTCRLPEAAGDAGPLPTVAAVAVAPPPAVGQGGQRQPATPRARTASQAHTNNVDERGVMGSGLCV